MATFLYQACFCEENVWHLCHHQALSGLRKWVIFISNSKQQCPIWFARSAPSGQPVIWDYHVILATWQLSWQVWDLDTALALPVALQDYLSACFQPVEPDLQPRFRAVEANSFVELFSSNRAHMITQDGCWYAPPPAWPPIFNGRASNLDQWMNMSQAWHGQLCDLAGLPALLEQMLKGH